MAATREELRRELLALGPPEAADLLVALARDCILLRRERCEDAEIPIGASKLGGAPDLPLALPRPQGVYDPMAFLAQIDLAEITALPPPTSPPEQGAFDFGERPPPVSKPLDLLPITGLLSFFYETHALLHGTDVLEDRRFGRVLLTPAGTSLARRPLPAVLSRPSRVPVHWPIGSGETYEPGSVAYKPCRVRLERAVMPPDDGSHTLAMLPRDDDMGDAIRDLADEWPYHALEQIRHLPPAHHMLGHQKTIQYDYEEPGEVLLLQIDTDYEAGITWGDGGALYVYITERDLRRGDFSRVRMIWDCS
jgi:uncharacterized protein YwqG